MKEIKISKLAWLFLYLLCAGISCWATAESLNLTFQALPLLTCYCVAIGFYLVASVGAAMVAKAFDKNKIKGHRGWLLTYGIVILIFFWLLVSLPTNTHTFLYQSNIAEIGMIKRVDDLWREFLFGSYRGNMAMIISVLVSLFIDLAAFVSYIVSLRKAPQMASVKAAKMTNESDTQLN